MKLATDHFTLSIDLGNEAMQAPEDVASALEAIAQTLRRGRFDGNSPRPIRDVNGNTVGTWTWESTT